MTQAVTVGNQAVPAGAGEILNSWKEIASYLKRGIRTVQRWEVDLGMPVRRPRGRGRSAVIAIRSELDSWINSRPLATKRHTNPTGARTLNCCLEQIRASVREMRQLCAQVRFSRKQLSSALGELRLSVQKLRNGQPLAPSIRRSQIFAEVAGAGIETDPASMIEGISRCSKTPANIDKDWKSGLVQPIIQSPWTTFDTP